MHQTDVGMAIVLNHFKLACCFANQGAANEFWEKKLVEANVRFSVVRGVHEI